MAEETWFFSIYLEWISVRHAPFWYLGVLVWKCQSGWKVLSQQGQEAVGEGTYWPLRAKKDNSVFCWAAQETCWGVSTDVLLTLILSLCQPLVQQLPAVCHNVAFWWLLWCLPSAVKVQLGLSCSFLYPPRACWCAKWGVLCMQPTRVYFCDCVTRRAGEELCVWVACSPCSNRASWALLSTQCGVAGADILWASQGLSSRAAFLIGSVAVAGLWEATCPQWSLLEASISPTDTVLPQTV